uniref:Polyketide synthase n=1 Tax=Pestalotiopsis microspora TaxID=85828 RepID=A0A1P8NTI1_PESMI|nr:polyketide synthase [Pestalotiopsis microspora]
MANDTPIAVVGISYRAPGIGRKGLWDYLAQARSAWTKIPADRFDSSAYYKPGAEKSGVFRAEGAHFVPDDIYTFDAAFFNMRAEEARNSDPQHRMMLECALEAAEDAGHSLLDLAGQKIGVFVGCGQQEYSQRLGDDQHSAKTFSATGVAPCMVANRISYFFDIDGPSVALDAACASSVYAAHQAVSALRNGECDGAFVGAAALTLGPGGWLALEKTGALSADGRSYSYDEKASGFGRGEGAACLLIKRLDDAIRDGDPVHALIRSSACNHGGRSDGITMPNGVAHRKLLRTVHEVVGLDPSHTPVVEGHGTGTNAGDPIEAGAFAAVLGQGRSASNPIYIGSIKSNFGHLEGASGVLGMVKAILMVKNGVILPTAGFEHINHKIEGKDIIRVLEAPIPWPKGEPKRALVTNFGFGGSNSAIIIEEAPSDLIVKRGVSNGVNGSNGTNGTNGVNTTNGAHIGDISLNGNGMTRTNGAAAANGANGLNGGSHGETPRLFVFSAKTDKSLKSYLASFDEYLDEAPSSKMYLKDLAYTLGQRRTHHPHRVAIVASSVEDLQDKALVAKTGRVKDRNVAFAFTGQGAQYAKMGSGLRHYKAFADAMDMADRHLQEFGASWSLTEELSKPAAASRVDDPEISQPACTAIQLALLALLKTWSVDPTAVTGHSSGEIAAAYAAGLLSFRTALAVAYFRGQAAAKLAREQKHEGAMLALGVGPEAAEELISKHSSAYATIAAINSPESVTISGDKSAIESIHQVADARGIFARKLKVSMAYHSRHMEIVADSYLEAITPYCESPIEASDDPQLPLFISSVEGRMVNGSEVAQPSYWIQNLVQPVRFAEATQSLLNSNTYSKIGSSNAVPNVVLEIGPHGALKSPIKQTIDSMRLQQTSSLAVTYFSSLDRSTDATDSLLNLAAKLFATGTNIQLGAVNLTDMSNATVVTDLPAYEWDKSTKYELKSRATHEKLFPGDSYHPLLGRRVSSNGAKDVAYRQVFTLDEAPWIRDHNVAGAVIFPMTGYMSCAIEAARRTSTTVAAAFLIRDFHVVQSLEIEEEQTVDMSTRIRPASTGSGGFSTKIWSFDISSWTEANGWTTHCYGTIESEKDNMTTETPTLANSLRLVDTNNLIEHDINYAYENAGVRATRYGPTFRNTVRFYEGQGYTVLEHRLRDLGKIGSGPLGSNVTVDPPTLDGFLQGGGPLQKADGKRPAQMPNYISRFRVSNNIPEDPQQRFDVVTRLLDYDVKGGRMKIGVAAFARHQDNSLTPVAEWESVVFRSIGSAEEFDPALNIPDNWAWDLLPRYDYLKPDDLQSILSVGPLGPAEYARSKNLEIASLYFIDRALKETASDDRSKLPIHLSKFVNWATRINEQDTHTWTSEPTDLLNGIRARDAQGELLCIIGNELVRILRQEVQTLEIMLTDGRLTRHYEADVENAHLSRVIGDLASNLSDLEPNLRILEIGGGTAGTTLPVLEALSRDREEPGFLNYTFTDISSGFFENARNKLSKWAQRVTYKKLDITQSIEEQDFAPQQYDIIIASNVLHATQNMTVTMTNVRHLLKPKGKLLLLEANRHPASVLPFALLPGWWYAEDKYRDHDEGPMVSVETWNQLLIDTGFSGVDVTVQDRPGSAEQMIGVIGSHRVGEKIEPQVVTVVGQFLDDAEIQFGQLVADTISEHLQVPIAIVPFAEIDLDDEPSYIFLDSPRHPICKDVSADAFETLKQLLIHNRGLLWVIPEDGPPESQFVKGIIRTLRIETEPKNLLVLDSVPTTSEGLSGILKLVQILQDSESTRDSDQDFVWHEGSLHLPRMRQLKDVKEQFAIEQGVGFRKEQALWSSNDALELTIEAAGNPDSIFFRRVPQVKNNMGDDEVLVKVSAAGMSQRDLDLVLGAIPWASPGFDGAGTVVARGSSVKNVAEGDKVAQTPTHMTDTEAASMPLAYSLALLALKRTARIMRNETVLIHSAAGAVGQACVTIAQHAGARVFATAGTESKRDLLHTTFGIPKDHIFSSRTSDFRDGILCQTGGKGVDVIVNSLTGELMTETWSLCAPFGRFIEIGRKDAFQNSNLPMRPFDNNVTFSGVDLRELYRHRPDSLKETFGELATVMEKSIATPIQPVTVLPISQFAAGLRKLKSGDTSGKIVIALGEDDRVIAESQLDQTQVALRSDATYVITGGTRGIGLDLAYWMIENGARNVVVLGRSGASGPEVQKLLAAYQNTDVCVRALACDVGSKEELSQVLNSIRDLPPVRGVVHSALLLSDKLFENATFEDWEIITRPRVQGAWNLDDLMPGDLDFFILLSSFLGDTGNEGQGIYAGTAVFYDAFTRYRNAKGQNTVSIALPVVLDVGYVADNDLSDTLKQSLGATLTMADIRTLIKGAVQGQSSPFNSNGKAAAFKMYLDGQAVRNGPWKYFHPVHTKERLKADRKQNDLANEGGSADMSLISWTAAADPLTGLTEALISKVSTMTMIEREDVGANVPLASFSLDSLVSVELRNWIRRETTIELPLGAITQAESLQSLASSILAQRESNLKG